MSNIVNKRIYSFVAVAVFFVLTVMALKPILMPFLVAAMIAYLTDPVVDQLEAKGLSRSAGVAVVFAVSTVIGLLLAVLIIPLLGKQFIAFVYRIPDYIDVVQSTLLPYFQSSSGGVVEAVEVDGMKKLIAEHWQSAGSYATQIFSQLTASTVSLFAWIANIVLIPVVTFYLLRDWDKMIAAIHDILPRAWESVSADLAKQCDEVLSAFIRGQLLVMASLAIVYSVGLSLMGLDLALFIGTLAGLASIVAYLGAIVGIASATIAAYMQFQELLPLIYVGAVFSIGQMLEGMFLTPLLVGDKIGLHPVAVIFAIMAGGQLAGFTGVLLALPVASVLMVLLRYVHEEYKLSDIYTAEQHE